MLGKTLRSLRQKGADTAYLQSCLRDGRRGFWQDCLRDLWDRYHKRGMRLAAALAVTFLIPQSVAAAQKPTDMDQGTWDRLQDNVLEYDEIGDRIQNFNPTIQQIVSSIEESFDTVQGNAAEYDETLNDLEWLCQKAKDEGDYASAAMYQVNKTIAMQMASGLKKSTKKMDTTIDRSTRQARKGLTSGCQQMMLAYNKMAVNKATLEKQVELYGAMAAMSSTQSGIGMATQVDILSANAQMHSAQTSLTSLTDQMASVKRSLLLMTGWDHDSDVVIGAIPKADMSQIDAIDLEADKVIAPTNNYTLIEMRNAAPADPDGNGKYTNSAYAARARGVEQGKQQLSITLDSLYQTLLEKRAALQAAETAFQSAQLKWNGANLKYQMGMLGRAEYLGEEIAYYAAKGAYESADLDVSQALLNYHWGVNGFGELAE